LARPGSLRRRPVTVELRQKLGITWCSQVSRSKMTGFTVRTKDMNWKAFDASPAPGHGFCTHWDSNRRSRALAPSDRAHQYLAEIVLAPYPTFFAVRK
jgi:hypothetical protein